MVRIALGSLRQRIGGALRPFWQLPRRPNRWCQPESIAFTVMSSDCVLRPIAEGEGPVVFEDGPMTEVSTQEINRDKPSWFRMCVMATATLFCLFTAAALVNLTVVNSATSVDLLIVLGVFLVLFGVGVACSAGFYNGDRAFLFAQLCRVIGLTPPAVHSGARVVQALALGVAVPVAVVWLCLRFGVPLVQAMTGVDPPSDVLGDRSNWYFDVPVGLAVLGITAAAVGEEVIFRGFGLMVWQLRTYPTEPKWRTVSTVVGLGLGFVLSTAAFGLSHSGYGPWNVVLMVPFGAVLFVMTILTRALWPAIVAHTVWNLHAFGLIALV